MSKTTSHIRSEDVARWEADEVARQMGRTPQDAQGVTVASPSYLFDKLARIAKGGKK